ncbi:HAD-IA family hydrolase [Levilactobacillus bambusae]|uniref:HAD-IA family hydrolase n=1 Tax=Levilactobacillus bambusae TaxID=2024736 RepID=UPI00177B5F95|nr:HAD-IA family hydrolase [Levilactobacillus bambusae]
MRYSQIFWDFDGTIMNTYPSMVEAVVKALTQMGISEFEIDDGEIYEAMRQSDLETALTQASAMYNLDKAALKDRYEANEKSMVKTAKPFLGVPEILQFVVDNGGRNFLLTHRDQSALKGLEAERLASFFTGTVTKDQPFPRKPNPASLESLMTTYVVDKDAAMMVGDRNLDVEAGHNAGIAGALFDPDHLIRVYSNPEIRVSQMPELEEWLEH